MSKDTQVYLAEGTVAFESLRELDVYRGAIGKHYTVKINLSPDVASFLEEKEVKIGMWNDSPQRKFKTMFPPNIVLDNGTKEGEPYDGPVPKGSLFRLTYTIRPDLKDPTHGVPVYFNNLKVLVLAEPASTIIPEDF